MNNVFDLMDQCGVQALYYRRIGDYGLVDRQILAEDTNQQFEDVFKLQNAINDLDLHHGIYLFDATIRVVYQQDVSYIPIYSDSAENVRLTEIGKLLI